MKSLKRLLKQAELDEDDASYEALAKELIKSGYGLELLEEKYIVKTTREGHPADQWSYAANRKGWAMNRFQRQVEEGNSRNSITNNVKLIKVGVVLLETLEKWKRP